MRQRWTPDTIRFLRDAAANSNYYQQIARRAAAFFPRSARVCDAGCGLGELAALVCPMVFRSCKVPLLLDADALNYAARWGFPLASLPVPLVLTPHPGELSRLTGESVQTIQRGRLEAARQRRCGAAQRRGHGGCRARGALGFELHRQPWLGQGGQRRCAGRRHWSPAGSRGPGLSGCSGGRLASRRGGGLVPGELFRPGHAAHRAGGRFDGNL